MDAKVMKDDKSPEQPATPPARRTGKRTRIQQRNESRILDAALDIFSSYGFRGATLAQIAKGASMTKPNLLYYFGNKEEIYIAVLSRTLANWLQPLEDLDPDGDPVEEIRGYIRRKLELARDHPHESQLFANEILAGAPMLKPVLEGELKALVDEKAGVIGRWIGEGRLNPVEPRHLIFMIWATTQHYSDFAPQIEAVLGDRDDWFPDAMSTVETIFIEGLKPRP